jgi:WD40 repeat protein
MRHIRASVLLLCVALGLCGTANSEPVPEGKPPGPEKRPEKTDRYGDPLPPGAVARLGTIRFRHPAEIWALALSPDGKIIATAGGWSTRIYLWETATGKPGGTLPSPGVYTQVMQFSPDGKTLAVSGCQFLEINDAPHDKTFLWDVRTRKPRHALKHNFGVTCLAFTPDSKTLVIGSGRDKEGLSSWDVISGKELPRLPTGGVAAAVSSPNGQLLATTAGEKGCCVRLWNWRTGREVALLETESRVNAIAFAPDGKTLLTGQNDPHFVRLWDVSTHKLLREFDGHKKSEDPGPVVVTSRTGRANCVAFSPDGASVASGGTDGRLLLWEVRTGKLRSQCQEPGGAINGVAFTPDGKTLVRGGASGCVRVLDTATGKELHFGDGHPAQVVDLALASGGKLLATAGQEGTICLWDLSTSKTLRVLGGHKELVRSIQFSQDGRTLVSASQDGTVRLWDVAAGKERKLIKGQSYAAFAADGDLLASAAYDRIIKLRDPITGRQRGEIDASVHAINTGWLTHLTVSPDGKWIAGIVDGSRELTSIKLWKATAGAKQGSSWIQDFYPSQMRFTPDSRHIVYTNNRTLCFIDVEAGKEPQCTSFTGVTSFTFANGGRWLVSADDNQRIHFRELVSGLELHRITGPDCGLWKLAMAPDDRALLTLNRDSTVLVWDLAPPTTKKPEDMDQHWAGLASRDGPAGYRAMWSLMADPKEAVKELSKRLPECQRALVARHARLTQLIAELDNDSFKRREAASKELAAFGAEAESAMRQALADKPPLEARKRLEKLLAKEMLLPGGEMLRGVRAVMLLERIGTPEARAVLQTAAKGPPEDRLTKEAKAALERLAKRPKPARAQSHGS